MIDLVSDRPADWIPHGGKPARALPHDGLPSYESDHGALLVYDVLLAFENERKIKLAPGFAYLDRNEPLLLPRSYDGTAMRSGATGEALVPLYDDPDAMWSWRPLIYEARVRARYGIIRLGSQQELEWRIGLYQARMQSIELQDLIDRCSRECAKQQMPYEEFRVLAEKIIEAWRSSPPEMEFIAARERGEKILREHLNPHQLLDLEVSGSFLVRGTINRLYRVEPGNGLQILHPETHAPIASLCLHPETWIPHDDVALATKLLIESGREGEQQVLEGARTRPLKHRWRASREEREAWRMERELLPAPYAEVNR